MADWRKSPPETQAVVSGQVSTVPQIALGIEELAMGYPDWWPNKPDTYWLMRLMQEVGEAASALAGDHEGPLNWELCQIAGICMNWLGRRNMRYADTPADGGERDE